MARLTIHGLEPVESTLREYGRKGAITLSAIEKAIYCDTTGYFFNGDFGVEARRTQIKVQESKRQAVQVAQQLAWMISVFRTRKDRDSGKNH